MLNRLTNYLLAALIVASTFALAAPTTAPTSAPENKWESDIAKFEADDASNPPAPSGIVFYGSSTIRFWDVKKSFPDLPVLNRGFGGSHMYDAAKYEHRVLPAEHPKTVVLYEGDNDIADHRTSQQIVHDFESFADQLHKDLPDTKLIVISIKPSPSRWKMFDTMKETNSMLRDRIAERATWASYLDIVPLMLDEKGQPISSLYRDDRLHMTDAGYERWTKVLAPLLK